METSLESLTVLCCGSMCYEFSLHQHSSTGDRGKLGMRQIIYNCLPGWTTDIFHSKSLMQQSCQAVWLWWHWNYLQIQFAPSECFLSPQKFLAAEIDSSPHPQSSGFYRIKCVILGTTNYDTSAFSKKVWELWFKHFCFNSGHFYVKNADFKQY